MKHTLPTTPCKGCGKPIVFAKAENGAIIPLDARPPMYYAYLAADGVVRCLRMSEEFGVEQSDHAFPFVTHFATCPAANQFSKKGKDHGRD